MNELNLKAEQTIESVENFEFEPIKGEPRLNWRGKRPFRSTQYYPAQLKDTYGEEVNGWINKIFWGDNLQVMSHLLKKFRGQVDLIYIDPPFDSKADYKKKISVRGKKVENDSNSFEEKQYGDIWTNDEYLQFMYERLVLLRELLNDEGVIYLHCDWHKVHLLRCIMDEIFTQHNFRNEIIWCYSTLGRPKDRFAQKHDNILVYGKTTNTFFNVDGAKIPYSNEYIKSHFTDVDDEGKICRKRYDAGKWRIYYPDEGMIPNDYWRIAYENSMSTERTGYPTQKPEELLERIIKASTKEGGLVFDCFMGSGTTQAVAMKLGRRFIGADINLGSIDTTTKRLLNIKKGIEGDMQFDDDLTIYTSFEVYNVNNYDVFRNPVEAKALLKKALEIQDLPNNELYDGEKEGRMVKIMPINRIATRSDLNELITNFPRNTFDERKNASPTKPVEELTIVCMGHEPDLGEHLKLQMKTEGYLIDVEVVDILRDKSNLEFKRDSEAEIVIEGDKLVIRNFFPMNLLQKLSLQKEEVDNWKQLVDSIKIDFNYDGTIFEPKCIDIPDAKDMVKGIYQIPSDAGKIRVRITDLLSESLEMTVE